MDYWKRSSEQREKAWNYLWDEIDPDIALLQEFVPPEEIFDTHKTLYHEFGGRRNWGNVVISKHSIRKELHFSRSCLGSNGVIVAEIAIPDFANVSVINVYGLIDPNGYATTTMHHILSDLTPILHKKKKQNIILAGDFNVSAQWDEKYRNKDPSHKLVFDRLEDFGLVDCTKHFFNSHVQTHAHSKSTFEWQNDYIFVNKGLIDQIKKCEVFNTSELNEFSDHYPVCIEA